MFLKDGGRRIFVQSDIGALIALRDTDKPLDDTAKDLAYQQKERLEESSEKELAIPDTYENLPQDPNQIKEILMFLANEIVAAREMNVQLTSDMSQLKEKVSRFQYFLDCSPLQICHLQISTNSREISTNSE